MAKFGYIGLGHRGTGMLKNILECFKDVEIVAICDLMEERIEEAKKLFEENSISVPFSTTNEDEFFDVEMDGVFIMTYWESHIPLAIKAMKKGIPPAIEVGGAYSIKECYDLLDTYEETGIHVMMLENCCYGKDELAVLKMVREGIFGTIVHCSGGYHHELLYEVSHGVQRKHYRLRNYISRNCDNYPTHELGPIAKVLNINRGNRMLQLNSVASKAVGLAEYVKEHQDTLSHLNDTVFNQGDIITTIITCANGETITLTLDTTLPRFYSRGFTVRGTKGGFFEDGDTYYLEAEREEYEKDCEWIHFCWQKNYGNGEEMRKKYKHPLWEKHGDAAATSGHDGMDYMVLAAYIESIEKKATPPIDTYDTVTWMAITPLSEQSIKMGGAPVAIPDFTKGKWAMPREKSDLEFALD